MAIISDELKSGSLLLLVLIFSSGTEGAAFGCNGEKLPCQVIPSKCSDASCFGVTIKKKDNQYTFVAQSPEGSGYVAVGISKDDKMGEDAVVLCTSDGQVSPFINRNGRDPSKSASFEISSSSSAVTNGHVTCSFTLPESVSVENLKFQVSESWILLARGDMQGGSPEHHKERLADKLDLSSGDKGTDKKGDNSGASSTPTAISGVIGSISLADFGCKGEKLPCQAIPSSCSDASCFGVTIKKKDNQYTFVAQSSIASGYVAVGISKDDKMGEDPVVLCTSDGQVLPFINPNGKDQSKPANFEIPSSSSAVTNGHVTCSFTLPESVSVENLKIQVSESWILLARGDMQGDIPMQHKERLSEKLDFNAAGQGDKGTTTVKKGDNSGASSMPTAINGVIGSLSLLLSILRRF